jgi:hypothetical protein
MQLTLPNVSDLLMLLMVMEQHPFACLVLLLCAGMAWHAFITKR